MHFLGPCLGLSDNYRVRSDERFGGQRRHDLYYKQLDTIPTALLGSSLALLGSTAHMQYMNWTP
jgi:hypothetical protein